MLAVILFAAGIILSKQQNQFGLRAFHVETGSMTPTLPIGSMVLVREQASYQSGDIITFRLEGRRDAVVTHRIVAPAGDPDINKIAYRTKGDANEDPDPESIPLDRVIGKVIFSVPYVGLAMGFAKTQMGFIALIVIPATLIIYGEIQNIRKEAVRLVKERQEKKAEKIAKEILQSKPKKAKKSKTKKKTKTKVKK